MAFDQGLAERIREILRSDHLLSAKKMFGGLAFSGGYLFIGVLGNTLMARVGPRWLRQGPVATARAKWTSPESR